MHANNPGELGKQWVVPFAYVQASTGTELFLGT